jgi:hypothetical protein
MNSPQLIAFQMQDGSPGEAAASIFSSQDYATAAFERYPDPAFFLPISAVPQIFMHNRAISGVG